MPGTLHVVATPIGNLEDVSPRALRVLGEVAAIAAEDTRTTMKLLARFGLRTPVVAYFQHSGPGREEQILGRLERGESVALVSEAGTPGLSDPGAALVAKAHARGIPVRSVPGPSSIPAALSVSGFPADAFVFEGFLPRKPGRRRKALKALADEERTIVLLESPHRVLDTLEALLETLGDRPLAVTRELTKLHEEVLRTTVSGALEVFRAREPRGEFTLVVAGRISEAEPPAGPGQATVVM